MITIKDVAKLSGVSISTVSRVINDSKPVSPEVRKKVLSVIEETGYKPNDVARSLVTRRSYLIGVIINNLAQSYVADIVRGIEEIGKMYDYDILLCSSYFSKDAQKKYLQLLDRKQAEGIFLVGHSFDDEILDLAKSLNKPCVYFTKKTRNDMEHICIDNFAASYEATNYLIKQGHKRIATISGPDKSGSGHERLSGYKEALEKYNIPFRPEYVEYGDFKYQKSYDATKRLLELEEPPTAIFSANNFSTLGAMQCFFEKNIVIGRDISIIGFDEIRSWLYSNPTRASVANISVIERPVKQMAYEAISLLQRNITEGISLQLAKRKVVLENKIVLNGSECLYTK